MSRSFGEAHSTYASLVGVKLVRSKKQTSSSSSLLFPDDGVRASFLERFIEDNGGRPEFEGLTTTDVLEKIIKPKTKAKNCSYCEWLLAHGNPNKAVGKATIFISHAMFECLFLDFVAALVFYFHVSHVDPQNPDPYLWINILNVNQHDKSIFTFKYLSETFMQGIAKVDKTVLVFAPSRGQREESMSDWMQDPIQMKRAWCLFEIYCTAATGRPFDVALSRSHQQQFVENLTAGGGQVTINKMLATINVETSDAFRPEDKEQIFAVVRKTVGFSRLNEMVFKTIRDFVIVAATSELERVTDPTEALGLKFTLAGLYESQGLYELAEPLYKECLAVRKEVLGDRHPSTLVSVNNLAELYFRQGRFELAIATLIP